MYDRNNNDKINLFLQTFTSSIILNLSIQREKRFKKKRGVLSQCIFGTRSLICVLNFDALASDIE